MLLCIRAMHVIRRKNGEVRIVGIKMIQGEFVQEYVFKLKYFLQLTFQKINRHKFLLFFLSPYVFYVSLGWNCLLNNIVNTRSFSFYLHTCSVCHLAGIAC